MTTIHTRGDTSGEQVVAALRTQLGAGYRVTPAARFHINPFTPPSPDVPSSVAVGLGRAQLLRAQVLVTGDAVHVAPASFRGLLWWISRFTVAPRVVRALREAQL